MLVPIKSDEDIELMLHWLNLPSVRKNMFTDQVISYEDHILWWNKASKSYDKQFFMFLYEGNRVGVVNYYDINREHDCYWGFYLGNSDNINSGSRLNAWFQLENEAIEYAFSNLGVKTVLCESFAFNTSVIDLHKRVGFRIVDEIYREKNGKQEKVRDNFDRNVIINEFGYYELKTKPTNEELEKVDDKTCF